MIVTIAVVLLVVVGALVVFILTRPDDFRIRRSAVINAPGDIVFSIINDLHQWDRWSPYDKRDPNMKKTYSGSELGPGASYAWNGNNQVGEGRMTIVESKMAEFVKMNLEFSRPFKANNEVTFALKPVAAGTEVSWIMDGKSDFMSKVFRVLVNMDKMVGSDFEVGLANLNAVAQAEVKNRK